MKKITLLLNLTLGVVNCSLMAQHHKTEYKQDSAVRAQSLYGELGGNGIFISVNYDFRFAKSDKGLGMRIGIGFFGSSSDGIITVPVAINHLSGKAPNYFEAGIGYTYAKFTGSDSFFEGEGGVWVPSIGYRYQPAKKGLVARIFISPLISATGGGWIFFGGLGIGARL